MSNERILRLKRALEESKESTEAARLRSHKRRAARRGRKGSESDDLERAKAVTRRNRSTVNDVERWFVEQVDEVFGAAMSMPKWRMKEKKLAKLMLDEFGADVLQGVVLWIFSNWDGLVEKSRGKLLGIPTIELLWARRATYIPQMQKEKMGYRPDPLQSARNADEFVEPKGTPDIGW